MGWRKLRASLRDESERQWESEGGRSHSHLDSLSLLKRPPHLLQLIPPTQTRPSSLDLTRCED